MSRTQGEKIGLSGSFTVRLYDREDNLVDEIKGKNVTTNVGRQRMLELWSHTYSHNTNPSTMRENFLKVIPYPSGVTVFGPQSQESYQQWWRDPSDWSNQTGENSPALTMFDLENENQWTDWHVDSESNIPNNIQHLGPHCIHFCQPREVVEEELLTGALDGWVDLSHTHLDSTMGKDNNGGYRSGQFVLTNQAGTVTYTQDLTPNTDGTPNSDDYSVDTLNGKIYFNPAGSISPASVVKATYIYYDLDDVKDFGPIVAMSIEATLRSYTALPPAAYVGMGAFSFDGGHTWTEHVWPWQGRPGGDQIYGSYRDNDSGWDWQSGKGFNPHRDDPIHKMWLMAPWAFNAPTHFRWTGAIYGSRGYSLRFKRWRFWTMDAQPQCPHAIAVGTDNTTPTINDTALGAEVARGPIRGGGYSADASAFRWSGFIDYDDGNGVECTEAGLFFGDRWIESEEPGTTTLGPIKPEWCDQLFARALFSSPWTKTENQRAEIIYELAIS